MVVDHSLWQFLLNSGPIVKAVLILLLIVSIISWTFIFQRYKSLMTLTKADEVFAKFFRPAKNITKLYHRVAKADSDISGLANIFKAGFEEFLKVRERSGVKAEALIESVQRAMRIAETEEITKAEQHLSFLATVGSTAPYVGLFGTVWGIMVSFQALGSVQQATIAMVAPGISEALIATAMGLFAAIPAVVAYNRYNNMVDQINTRYSSFQEEFTNVLYRELHGIKPLSDSNQQQEASADSPVIAEPGLLEG